MPIGWHVRCHLEAFMDRLTALNSGSGNVALVGTSIVCLSKIDDAVVADPSYYGPKVEGFAYAITNAAIRYSISNGYSGLQLGRVQTKEDAVIAGEYNLSRIVLLAPYKWSIASLLLEYRDVDFRDEKIGVATTIAIRLDPGSMVIKYQCLLWT